MAREGTPGRGRVFRRRGVALAVVAAVTLAVVGLVSAATSSDYWWGETVRGVLPGSVSAGAYSVSGDLQVAAPGDVTAGNYAVTGNSVGVSRSPLAQPPQPPGPSNYFVYLPVVIR